MMWTWVAMVLMKGGEDVDREEAVELVNVLTVAKKSDLWFPRLCCVL